MKGEAGMDVETLAGLVAELARRIERQGAALEKNETATRAALVDPLLGALGWDVNDPEEVKLEHGTAAGTRADYELAVGGAAVVVIEAKSLRSNTLKHAIRQALGYASLGGAPYVVATDGETWDVCEVKPAAPGKPARTVEVLSFSLKKAPVRTALESLWLWRRNFDALPPGRVRRPEEPAATGVTVAELVEKAAGGSWEKGKAFPGTRVAYPGETKAREVRNWTWLRNETIRWLVDCGRLKAADLPLGAPKGGGAPWSRWQSPLAIAADGKEADPGWKEVRPGVLTYQKSRPKDQMLVTGALLAACGVDAREVVIEA